jgi:uncharacterized protein YjiS (DUF1127 family)
MRTVGNEWRTSAHRRMTMYDFSDPKSRPSSYAFARQAHAERTLLMQSYLRSAARGLAVLISGLAEKVVKLAERMAAEQRLRRDMRALQKFDDRTLADIGVSRGAIEYLLRKGQNAAEFRVAAAFPRRTPRSALARKVGPNIDSLKMHNSAG